MDFTQTTELITQRVAVLNGLLGFGTAGDAPKVTFGYIGNCDRLQADGTWGYDDRSWSVFLPHPGRVGTSEDRIGSFPTGDVKGALACYRQLNTAVQIARIAKTVRV